MNIDADALAADRHLLGHIPETVVFQELRRQASSLEIPINFFHFRYKDGGEVDIVLESTAQRVAGIEVKAAATVTSSDFNGLRKLRSAAAEKFAGGVVLYDGESTLPFGYGLHAVPIRAL